MLGLKIEFLHVSVDFCTYTCVNGNVTAAITKEYNIISIIPLLFSL